jgi:hypothetical protein
MNPEQIQLLLRQREKPEVPQGYTEQLLRQLHQRQRSEFLQQSLWRIAADRFSTLCSEHSLSTPKYALALAALVGICLGVIALLKPVPGGAAMAKRDIAPKLEDPLRQRVDAQQVSFEK